MESLPPELWHIVRRYVYKLLVDVKYERKSKEEYHLTIQYYFEINGFTFKETLETNSMDFIGTLDQTRNPVDLIVDRMACHIIGFTFRKLSKSSRDRAINKMSSFLREPIRIKQVKCRLMSL